MKARNLIFNVFALSCALVNGLQSQTVEDIDGNVYKTVTIGTQVWMAENLKAIKYNDGTSIPLFTGSWRQYKTHGYCWYNNDAVNKDVYGALYNWYTVSTGKLCPKEWHVPKDEEWTTLETYLNANGYNFDGTINELTPEIKMNQTITIPGKNKIAKSLASTSGWEIDNEVGNVGNDQKSNNRTGFTALPGGDRYAAFYRDFTGCGWWTSTEWNENFAWRRYLYFNSCGVDRSAVYKQHGFYIRCLRDLSASPK